MAEEEAAAGILPGDLGEAFFLVDPLDGTKEFVKRSGDFTVNIALVRDGVPAIGVVYAPAAGAFSQACPDAPSSSSWMRMTTLPPAARSRCARDTRR